MSRFLSVAAACGLAGVVGMTGVALTRAAQPDPEREPGRAASPKQKLRERLVTLRADVALLQVEHDAMRANLLETLQGVEKAELLGIDLPSLLGTVKLELGGLSGNAEALREMSELMKKVDGGDKEEAIGAFKKTFDKGKKDFRAGVERKKQEFTRKVRALNEKKLDLDEAEQRYAATR